MVWFQTDVPIQSYVLSAFEKWLDPQNRRSLVSIFTTDHSLYYLWNGRNQVASEVCGM